VFSVDDGGPTEPLVVSLPVSDAALARVATGELVLHEDALRPDGGTSEGSAAQVPPLLAAGVRVTGRSGSVTARLSRTTMAAASSRVTAAALHVGPRVLTDHGVPLANIAYEIPGGVVCVRGGHLCDSFVIDQDLRLRTLPSWPRPILGELPFGARGAVAWSNGEYNDPPLEHGYVMYRHGPDEPVVTQELPFRPGWGTWWNNRVYWSCQPSGVGSWAPETTPALEFPDLVLFGIYVDQGKLILAPGIRDESGYCRRIRVARGWTWEAGGTPTEVQLGPEGTASARADGEQGWTAVAYPEADTIHLERKGRILARMTCYYPCRLAWLGRSLLVVTYDRELLLFTDLAGRLEQLSGA
jgi:hypothetical protein